MDEWNDNFDAKINVFKWKKLTIGLHQIKSWITSPYVGIFFWLYVGEQYKKRFLTPYPGSQLAVNRGFKPGLWRI